MLNKLGRKRLQITVAPRAKTNKEVTESEFGITPTAPQSETYTEVVVGKPRVPGNNRLYLNYPDTRNLEVILKGKVTQECGHPVAVEKEK